MQVSRFRQSGRSATTPRHTVKEERYWFIEFNSESLYSALAEMRLVPLSYFCIC
jgi:hypothetical protein